MREGSCTCGAVRFTIDGPVRDVIVCHCHACLEAAGEPWAASAARRADLHVEDAESIVWDATAPSEHDASRGRCRVCGLVVFWDAPGRETVSFAVSTLRDDHGLAVAGQIWTAEVENPRDVGGAPPHAGSWPSTVDVPWHS